MVKPLGLLSYKRCQKVSRKKTNISIQGPARSGRKIHFFFPWSQPVIKLGLCLRPGKETALSTVKEPIISTSKTMKGSSGKNFKNMLIIFFGSVGLLYNEFVVQGTTMNK